jgi:fumarate reductase flavoprotein subunit
MEQIQTHPTVVPGNGVMITEAVRGNGAVMVNREGKRFNNEMATRDIMSAAILRQTGKTSFLLFDQGIRESLKAIEGYARQGLLTQADTIAGLAEKLGIPAAALEETIISYNKIQASGNDTEFGRAGSDMPRAISTAPYYAVEVGPAVHHTMGGIKINTDAEVIDTSGKVISGLFAAGEVTGGVHGGNRLGGNAVADITIYGKIAADSALSYINTLAQE